MSDTLPLHTGRKADYKEIMRLIVPFSSSAGAQRRLLLRNASGRQAPEGRPSEIRSSGYVDQLYQMDRRSGAAGSPGTTSLALWKTSGGFPTITRHGWVCGFSTPCGTAKTYTPPLPAPDAIFKGEASEHPVWELLRSGKVKAVKDVSELLHP